MIDNDVNITYDMLVVMVVVVKKINDLFGS